MTAGPIDITVPGDKSLSHRAVMLASIARGRSRITGVLDSADVRSTAECMRRLGVAIPPIASSMEITGGGVAGLEDPSQDLDCGNSGTSARLLAGLVAGAGRTARFVGDASLSKRPMRRVTEPLEKMGARIVPETNDGLPLRIIGGPLKPIEYTSPVASAQIKSALLMAGLCARVRVVVHEPSRSRDHTERMLAALGVPVTVDGATVTLAANAPDIDGFSFDVPGDPSSAAFFAAWAMLTGRAVRTSVISTNPTRTAFFDALERVGATVTVESRETRCGEPVGRFTIRGAIAKPFVLGPAGVPSMIDELPLVACLAACVPGESRVTGAKELRVKESDRIAAVVSNLRAIGADAEELPDGFIVRGARKPYRGCVVTHGDHRIAMGFGVLGAAPGNAIEVDDPACVAVSFPSFWDTLARLKSA